MCYKPEHMNIVLTITSPLNCYRDKLLEALSNGGPYTDDHFWVICSVYEKEYNVETFEKLSELCDNVNMFHASLPPFDKEKRTLEDYNEEVVGFTAWRLKLEGETCYIPCGWVPQIPAWNKDGKLDFRQAATSFYGKLDGKDEEQHIVGPFFCYGSFFTTNPCVRGYNKKHKGFMHRARNYVNRSVCHMEADYFAKCCESGHCDAEQPQVEPQVEPQMEPEVVVEPAKPKNKSAKKKSGRKKRAKKKAAKKKSVKESLEEIRAQQQAEE